MSNIWNALSSNLWPFTIALINIWAICKAIKLSISAVILIKKSGYENKILRFIQVAFGLFIWSIVISIITMALNYYLKVGMRLIEIVLCVIFVILFDVKPAKHSRCIFAFRTKKRKWLNCAKALIKH